MTFDEAPEPAMPPGAMPADPGDVDAEMGAIGAQRRTEVAKTAMNGGDPSALPSDVQAALMDAATTFAKATGTEEIVQDLDGAVALCAAAHEHLIQIGREDLAGIVDPALLTTADQAMVLIQGLADPEVVEAINAPQDVPPVDGIPETVVGPPQGPMPPEPVTMESP